MNPASSGAPRILAVACGIAIVSALAGLPAGCGGARPEMLAVPGQEGALKSAASERAARRAYDGAPPVIPHEDFALDCASCHARGGVEVPGIGFSPPMPHRDTPGLSDHSRCRQCHVLRVTDGTFVASEFVGAEQDLRHGERLYDRAPPTLPHEIFMRENCGACHTGPAAREEIRTSHPERVRCLQCHVPVVTRQPFAPRGGSS